MIPPPTVASAPSVWRDGAWRPGHRLVAEETPIALSYNRLSHAVMFATPADLADFALGFSLAEGIVDHPGQIGRLDIVTPGEGVELRMTIDHALMARLETRRRRLAGATGCGLCGLESLDAAMRPPPRVGAAPDWSAKAIEAAIAVLRPHQVLGRETHATHAAAFWTEAEGLVALREDVGRHNALDKLRGALAVRGVDVSAGIVALSSRISVELVQKAAGMGAGLVVAVSAPTALALRTAKAAGITIAAVARDDGFELYRP
ncbi:FdhD protein [Endobacter medicaginis]|uniref:Sulfur carrier protein FdhD n=1 Tax=Endobacter medicaginis TaxID=1181271 RepID=A0A839V5K5_9PROT|nr:formate dehydrogenase accessory sulfurtransferase FdhD [Endobacter medicaginis]MBB3174832.1 FdhD protein [Endobacter medicaginis]MCX5475636.1 formate dehydrogenase accessory sulfurtransferase FdhD [Endobacter medicaginis]NVN29122.1 formate dehydrogenase accessory sulfurtransferase FdhD [Endobacter medicaginis]